MKPAPGKALVDGLLFTAISEERGLAADYSMKLSDMRLKTNMIKSGWVLLIQIQEPKSCINGKDSKPQIEYVD